MFRSVSLRTSALSLSEIGILKIWTFESYKKNESTILELKEKIKKKSHLSIHTIHTYISVYICMREYIHTIFPRKIFCIAKNKKKNKQKILIGRNSCVDK